MKQYISGYYCRNEFDLETLNNGNNRKIIDALGKAYPSGLTVKEIANQTGIPDRTIYPQIKSLSREHFVVEMDKQTRPRGRPSRSKVVNLTAQRASGQFTIEESTPLFDPSEGKERGETPLPPGYVEFSSHFLRLWDRIHDFKVKELEEEELFILRTIQKKLRAAIESDDTKIQNIVPRNNLEYCCCQCGVNHEARNFIRALSLRIIDEMENSEAYLRFLKENNFITEDAFNQALTKLPKTYTWSRESIERFLKEGKSATKDRDYK